MQAHNPKIVTNGLICHLDPTNGGKGGSKILAKPTQVDDCALWLDAADTESVVGSTVTDWLDKSGNGNHLGTVDGDPAYGGNYKINDKQVIYFDGNDSIRKDSTVMSGATAATCFVVYQPTIDATSTSWCVLGTINNDNYWYYTGDNAGYWGVFTNSRLSALPSNTHNYNAQNHTVICTSVAGSTYGIYWNGEADATVSGYDYSSNAFSAGDRFIVGAGYNTSTSIGRYFKGYIAEVIAYSRELSDTERQQVEYYLSRKWAIPLKNRAMTNLANGDRVGELFPNGDFPSGLSDGESGYDNGDGTVDGWSLSSTGSLAVASDTPWGRGLRINRTGSGYGYANGYLNVTNLKTGSTYKASVDYDTKTAGSVAFGISGATVNVGTGSGTYVTTWVETGTSQPFYTYVYSVYGGIDTVYAEFSNFSVVEVGGSPVETTNKNAFYFPNPDDDVCDLRLEANEIVVADNLPWTMEFWIKRHARGDLRSVYSGIWGNDLSSGNERLQFTATASEDKLILVDDGNNNSATAITNSVDIDCLHKWRHVVLAFDGTTDATTAGCVRQYVDGSDKGPAIALPNADSGTTIRRIASRGSTSDAHRLEGELGNFRVYNKQLSHAEVLQNYNAQRAKYQNKKMSFAAPDNLKLYLDAQSGTSSNYYADGTWYDISGGTANNATRDQATFTDGGVKYYDFDGTNDEFVISDESSLDITSEITQEMWFNADNLSHGGGGNYPTPIAKNQQNYRWFIDTSGIIHSRYASLSDLTATTTISTGVWYHVVLTKDSGGFTWYINGAVSGSDSQSGAITANNDTYVIGNWDEGGTRAFDGKIAMVRIYNKALSADEALQNYNHSKHRFGK